MKNKITYGATVALCVLGLADMDYGNLSVLNVITIVIIAIVLISIGINLIVERRGK